LRLCVLVLQVPFFLWLSISILFVQRFGRPQHPVPFFGLVRRERPLLWILCCHFTPVPSYGRCHPASVTLPFLFFVMNRYHAHSCARKVWSFFSSPFLPFPLLLSLPHQVRTQRKLCRPLLFFFRCRTLFPFSFLPFVLP